MVRNQEGYVSTYTMGYDFCARIYIFKVEFSLILYFFLDMQTYYKCIIYL